MEVGIDVDWNVVRFGACSISIYAMDNELKEEYIERLLTEHGKQKREADTKMIRGDYSGAVELYFRAHSNFPPPEDFLLSRTFRIPGRPVSSMYGLMDCSKEISICKRAHSRQHYGRSLGFVHSKDSLQALQILAVSSTLGWRDPRSTHTTAAE